MELIISIIVLVSLLCVIIESYNKQKEKHKRMKEWMKEHQKQLKQDNKEL